MQGKKVGRYGDINNLLEVILYCVLDVRRISIKVEMWKDLHLRMIYTNCNKVLEKSKSKEKSA